jgi:hypothetical protein
MPDRCTPEYERVVAAMGAALPYRRALALLGEFFPLGSAPAVETTRRRTLRVGARLERAAPAAPQYPAAAPEAGSIALGIDAGHVRSVRRHRVRSFEAVVAQVGGAQGKSVVFGSVPAEADRQQQQLRGVLHRLGAVPGTPVTRPGGIGARWEAYRRRRWWRHTLRRTRRGRGELARTPGRPTGRCPDRRR